MEITGLSMTDPNIMCPRGFWIPPLAYTHMWEQVAYTHVWEQVAYTHVWEQVCLHAHVRASWSGVRLQINVWAHCNIWIGAIISDVITNRITLELDCTGSLRGGCCDPWNDDVSFHSIAQAENKSCDCIYVMSMYVFTLLWGLSTYSLCIEVPCMSHLRVSPTASTLSGVWGCDANNYSNKYFELASYQCILDSLPWGFKTGAIFFMHH
jgi:hypothetical protein